MIREAFEGEEMGFPTALYERFVKQATVAPDGTITYALSPGFTFTIDMQYAPYKRARVDRIKQERKQKKEDFLKGPDVEALIAFCEEPRQWRELVTFMNERLYISQAHLRATVTEPLLKEGRLIKVSVPEKSRKWKLFLKA